MATKQGTILLQGVIEADDTYVGGKPRKRNKCRSGDDSTSPLPRHGLETSKTPIIGAVECGGEVIARLVEDSRELRHDSGASRGLATRRPIAGAEADNR